MANILSLLQSNWTFTLILAGLLGLIVGSFLNVVIFRYPQMLYRQWRTECLAFLKQETKISESTFNLAIPASHCPSCKKSLKAWHNIPVFSYLFLRGRCTYCHTSISIRYPIVEILSAAMTLIVINSLGLNTHMLFALLFTWGLIVLSAIDIQEKILPDTLTLSLLWTGLFINIFYLYTTPTLAITGAILGYLLLWITAWLFKIIRKKEGMGHGDFKMLAMLGAWLGSPMLLNILLVASVLGLITGLCLLIFRKISPKNPIPFGPFLAVAGWLTLLYGPFLTRLLIIQFK